jgi:hypothetical protein
MHHDPIILATSLSANHRQPSVGGSSTITNALPSVANIEEKTRRQPSHVAHLEDSPETLENRQPSIMWRGQGPPPAPANITAPTSTTKKKELMIYRGKLFATQYFGPTHPITWGARVCLSFRWALVQLSKTDCDSSPDYKRSWWSL